MAYLEPNAEKKPRLVWDGTVGGSNPNVQCEETSTLPGMPEVTQSDTVSDSVGLKVDVRAAYKRVRVRQDQVRYLLFAFAGLYYHWNVLPFGHSVSALWWQRTGALSAAS